MIFLELLRSSFRCIDVLREGQGPNSDDETDALFVCNAMLDTWGAKRLLVYAIQILQYTFVPAQNIYTIGPGGDFSTGTAERPEKIERANLILNDNEPDIRRPIEILTFERWSEIKAQDVTTDIPLAIYPDKAFPLGNLYVYPVPDKAYPFELYVWQQLSQIASVNATITLPPAYAEAIKYNLAIRLSLEWGKPLKPGVAVLAQQALAALESQNAPQPKLRNDAHFLSIRRGSRPTFNIRDGSGR